MPNFLAIGQSFAKICRFFHFSNMAAFHDLGFVMHVFGPSMKGIWWALSLQNLVGIDAVVFDNIFFSFREFGLKMPNQVPKIGVLRGQQRNPCTDCKSAQ